MEVKNLTTPRRDATLPNAGIEATGETLRSDETHSCWRFQYELELLLVNAANHDHSRGRKARPLAMCTECGWVTHRSEMVNAPCLRKMGKLTCGGSFSDGLQREAWEGCRWCEGSGMMGGLECRSCRGIGWCFLDVKKIPARDKDQSPEQQLRRGA